MKRLFSHRAVSPWAAISKVTAVTSHNGSAGELPAPERTSEGTRGNWRPLGWGGCAGCGQRSKDPCPHNSHCCHPSGHRPTVPRWGLCGEGRAGGAQGLVEGEGVSACLPGLSARGQCCYRLRWPPEQQESVGYRRDGCGVGVAWGHWCHRPCVSWHPGLDK